MLRQVIDVLCELEVLDLDIKNELFLCRQTSPLMVIVVDCLMCLLRFIIGIM